MAKFKKICLRILVSMSLAHPVLSARAVIAQSKDDTIEFLEAYANDSQQVKVEDCIATIWIWAADGRAKEIVHLNAINPTTISLPVRIDDWITSWGKYRESRKIYRITFKTVNKNKAIMIEEWASDGSHTLPHNGAEGGLLVGNTPELAKRLRKAFEHLVRLCGGKEEPF